MYEHWLSSPGRMGWLKGKQIEGCVFCRIAEGDKRVPSRVLHRGKKFMVIMNIFPYNAGHLQVLPVKHVLNIEDMSDADVSEMFILVKRCMILLKKVLSPLGFNMGVNQGGDVAGASIDHLHIHIVPRYRRDFGFMEVIGKTKVLPIDVDETFSRLKKHVDILKD